MGFISLSLLPLALVLHPAFATASSSSATTHAHAHAGVRSLRSGASASTRHENRHLTSISRRQQSDDSDDSLYGDDYWANYVYDDSDYANPFFWVANGGYSVTYDVVDEDLSDGGFYSWWDADSDANRVCPVSGDENDATSGPACLPSSEIDAENGVWICRHLYNVLTGEPRSETICADPTYDAIMASPIDECGCCNGICPEVCSCTCTTDAGLEGVRILWNETTFVDSDYYDNTSGPYEECLDKRFVTSVLARGGDIMSCQTDCSAPESYQWQDVFFNNGGDDANDDANPDDGENNNNDNDYRKLKKNVSRRTKQKKNSRRTKQKKGSRRTKSS